jgi:DNA-binding transcriptional ArsR family regulator
MEDDQSRGVYSAIADPTRRQMMRLLADGQELPLHTLTAPESVCWREIFEGRTLKKRFGMMDIVAGLGADSFVDQLLINRVNVKRTV